MGRKRGHVGWQFRQMHGQVADSSLKEVSGKLLWVTCFVLQSVEIMWLFLSLWLSVASWSRQQGLPGGSWLCNSFLGTTCFHCCRQRFSAMLISSLPTVPMIVQASECLYSNPAYLEHSGDWKFRYWGVGLVLSAILTADDLHSPTGYHPMGQIHPSTSLIILFGSTIFVKDSLLQSRKSRRTGEDIHLLRFDILGLIRPPLNLFTFSVLLALGK